MDNEKYLKYLDSEEWKQKSRQRIRIDEYQCTMCRCTGTSNNPLQVHHFTYHNLYHEDVYKDLVTLCRTCHKSVHYMMNRKTDAKGTRGWKDTLRISDCVVQLGNAKQVMERNR